MAACIYSHRPRRRLGVAVSVTVFLLCASMAFSAVGLNNDLRRLFVYTEFFLLTVAAMMFDRFISKSYSYAVYSGESVDLVVYENAIFSKETVVVCRISLSSVTDVSEIHGKEKRKKIDKTADYNSYTASMLERDCILLSYSEYDESGVIRLSFDKDLLKIIETYK